jgi:hypothetical protein
MLASGRIGFALGVALGLASLRALQREWRWVASAVALACALASPVAAVFLIGVLLAGAAASSLDPAPAGWSSWASGAAAKLAPAAAALALVAVLYLAFPGAGREPFSFSAYVAVPLWCVAALYLMWGRRVEREFRIAVLGYLAMTTLLWLVPNAVGGNVTRLGALFGGPVLAAVLLSSGGIPAFASSGGMLSSLQAKPLRMAVIVLALAGSAYWQVQAAARDVIESLGDPSTERVYYRPLAQWLRSHGGLATRIEIPPTLNHWESAYLAPDFQLARGWLRQLDRTRNDIFYEGRLSHARYLGWLRRNGVHYVALSDSKLDYAAEDERDLIADSPPYLRLRAFLPGWRVYEVRGADSLEALGAGRARLLSLGPQSFELRVREPGRFIVRVRSTPYWRITGGAGCVGRAGEWTLVRADRKGLLRASIAFSVGRAGRAATGGRPRC